MFIIGQRWYSETEPELGLGMITVVEEKTIQVTYPESSIERRYGFKTAPLKRFELAINDSIQTNEDFECIVVSIRQEAGLYYYQTKSQEIVETQIKAQIDISGPMQRFGILNYDTPNFFDLRYQAYLAKRNYQSFELKGFLGAKINLIAHQLYLCHDIINMNKPKVMLCDEVGLGKTIEAATVLHSFIQRELVENVLILVPDSLTNQWFIELFKKYSLSFEVLNADMMSGFDIEKSQRYIVSAKLLKESEPLRNKLKSYKWDALILDESHQIPFFKSDHPVANLVKDINEKTLLTLFLSATPEVMGEENLFAGLNTLDKDRYPSFDEFKMKQSKAHEVSQFIHKLRNDLYSKEELENYLSPEECRSINNIEKMIQRIVDRFGSGRNYFRNSRSHLEKFSKLFQKRKQIPYPITISGKLNDSVVLKAKIEKLIHIIDEYSEHKIFIICHSKAIIMKLNKALMEIKNYKITLFHSDQSLLERDRQAAFFADPEGAQLLLSTEVGSEGRNFEFAHHMVLFDLPKLPDQLEQRIGRLDRIGQLNDIKIHIPYIENSFEHTIYHFYNQVLGAFEEFPKGGNAFYQLHKEKIQNLLESPFDEKRILEELGELKVKYLQYKEENEKGRDYLLETRSFNPEIATSLLKKVRTFEEDTSCKEFLESTFAEIGIDFEQHKPQVYFAKPSHNMLVPSYSGLLSDGMSITFDRDYANHHSFIDLVSWEHPLVKTAFDLLLSSPLGNLTVIKCPDLPRDLYFEFIITLQCSDHLKHQTCIYLPFTPMRILISLGQGELTNKISKKKIDSLNSHTLNDEEEEFLKTFPKEKSKELKESVMTLAKTKAIDYQNKAITRIEEDFLAEENRLKIIYNNDAEFMRAKEDLDKIKKSYIESIKNAKLEIDSLRIIVGSK